MRRRSNPATTANTVLQFNPAAVFHQLYLPVAPSLTQAVAPSLIVKFSTGTYNQYWSLLISGNDTIIVHVQCSKTKQNGCADWDFILIQSVAKQPCTLQKQGNKSQLHTAGLKYPKHVFYSTYMYPI